MSVCLCAFLYNHFYSFFFFNHTATTEIYTLSLHDALPICVFSKVAEQFRLAIKDQRLADRLRQRPGRILVKLDATGPLDRKSTRLNSSHVAISYAVFCLKKKKKKRYDHMKLNQAYTRT